MPPNNNPSSNNARPSNQQLGPFDLVVDKLKNSSNVLVTVSANPSLDQLSACLGLTLVLNKLGKHATAVFSGKVPSSIEFLKPEKTLEKNTDSLRDFIIALDKSKADKLRYKVENDVVKIFITPYKTSITERDLQFSQGDFNVDAVVAIGVQDRSHLDAAITAHGRILHDATVIGVSNKIKSQFAAIDWVETRASSLSEMASDIAITLKRDALDPQISTSLLTGIVAETDRFRNEKSSPHTMSIAGILMAAGASTQLVATKLEESRVNQEKTKENAKKPKDIPNSNPDGAIRIRHHALKEKEEEKPKEEPVKPKVNPDDRDNIHIDDQGLLYALEYDQKIPDEKPKDKDSSEKSDEPEEKSQTTPGMILNPPEFSGQLTANSQPQGKVYDESTDPLSEDNKPKPPILGKKNITPNPSSDNNGSAIDTDQAREDVSNAAEAADDRPKPRQNQGSQDVNLDEGSSDKPLGPPPPGPPPMMPPTT